MPQPKTQHSQINILKRKKKKDSQPVWQTPKPMFFLLQQSTLSYTSAEVRYLRAELGRGRRAVAWTGLWPRVTRMLTTLRRLECAHPACGFREWIPGPEALV